MNQTSSAARPWHVWDRAEVEAVLDTGGHGLPEAEVRTRLERFGANQLEEIEPPGWPVVLLHQFRSPLIYILLLAAIVTLLLREYADSAVIGAVLALNALIGFVQERRAEASVRALMQHVAPRARVVRDGREAEVESRELVPGDVVLLESGARVPADIRLFGTARLLIDESLLTGESQPVSKGEAALEGELPLAERGNIAHMGTVVASGRGRGYVVETGARTALGSIAEHMRAAQAVETPLQARMARFARLIGIVVGLSAGAAFGLGVLLGEPATRMFTVAVALAVAAIPEGLPVVFTITLALGVRRMARRQAIIRHLPAVETLGSTTVIGSDKTGTLTLNRMVVQQVWAAGEAFDLSQGEVDPAVERSAAVRRTLLAGVLTNEAEIYRIDGDYELHGDPTEAALLVAAAQCGLDPQTIRRTHPVVSELPFEPERRYSASIRLLDDDHAELFVKGAPERIIAACTRQLGPGGLEALDADRVQGAVRDMAASGLRVLAMAQRSLDGVSPSSLEARMEQLVFLGLGGLMDPPRPGVKEAIAGCQAAGIRVVMITGDHADTAQAIARELGIGSESAGVITGVDLDRMDDRALETRVPQVSVYARVAPEHKLRIVRALRAIGETVAVTGDGVNDAPALKAADIGIAMGRSGTDVAREASDMVLADDNFVSIYAAVEEGRVTFDNLRKVTFFLVSTGAAAVVMILTALAIGWPLPMVAAQLLWLNLVTNGLQDVALAFEPGEPHVLKRQPRRRDEGVMSGLLWQRTVLAGLVMAAGTLIMFQWELAGSGSLTRAQTVALTTMVLFQVFHVGNARSETQSIFRRSPLSNPFLLIATAAALLVHVGSLYLAFTQFLLRVEPLDVAAWVRMTAVASSIIVAMELDKLWRTSGASWVPAGQGGAGTRRP